MKIAYFAHYFPPAGFAASINTYEIVKRLAERGHELLVFCQPTFSQQITAPLNTNSRLPNNVKIYRSFPTPLPLSIAIPHLANVFKSLQHSYDLIITQFHSFHMASYAGFFAKALTGKPWVVKIQDLFLDPSFHGPAHGRLLSYMCYEPFVKVLGKYADKLLIPTSGFQRFLERAGYSSNKIALMPHGVDTKLFSPEPSQSMFDSKKSVLYIGTMKFQYGLEYLIRAFSLLKHVPELELVMIGDGSERPALTSLARRLNLEDKVVFQRYISHEMLPEVIRNTYLTVGPLRSTLTNSCSIPSKVLEYFACGKTVVSTQLSRDLLIDGHTGLVLNETTPESIANSLLKLIEDEELTSRLGKNARQLVEERFDWEKIMDRFEKELQEV